MRGEERREGEEGGEGRRGGRGGKERRVGRRDGRRAGKREGRRKERKVGRGRGGERWGRWGKEGEEEGGRGGKERRERGLREEKRGEVMFEEREVPCLIVCTPFGCVIFHSSLLPPLPAPFKTSLRPPPTPPLRSPMTMKNRNTTPHHMINWRRKTNERKERRDRMPDSLAPQQTEKL